MPAKERIGEHEASIRNGNKRTTLGQHILEHSQEEGSRPRTTRRATVRAAAARKKGKTNQAKENAKTLEQSFKFTIAKRCKNSLNAFITEGILIKMEKPKINNMCGNGFVS